MLSFLREPEAGTSSDHSSATTGPQGVSSAGGPDAQEYLTVAANSKNVRRSTILVAILVAIGLLCLMFMIRKSQPQAASARQTKNDETKIDAAINRLTGVRSEMAGRMDAIIKKFYEFSDVFQVKVSELSKNPFEVESLTMKGLKVQAAAGDDPQAQAELIRRQKMQERAGTLRLLSIMRSDRGHSCMINDQILQQGQSLEGFTILQIGGNFVELAWSDGTSPDGAASETEDWKITLKLSE
jgi:preprotein translocase subunit SecG